VSVIYEIDNPSDPYTMVAEDRAVAAVAVVFLGEGMWGLSDREGKTAVPIFAFGGGAERLERWFATELGTTLAAVVSEKRQAIAAALRSVAIGSISDREAFDRGFALIDDPVKKEEWRTWWHDQRRSSLNDIGRRAWALADRLERTDPAASGARA
jgi:hypothetical protein